MFLDCYDCNLVPICIAFGHNSRVSQVIMVKKENDPIIQIGVRMPTSLRDALEEAARAEDRSINAQTIRILREWLREHSYLPND